jgi:HAD superfamily hydrolase (TIGR01549 family)
MIDGIIFDLDGTLVDSALDFDRMRSEMGLPTGMPILESLATLPVDEAERCRKILHEHELAGAERAVPLPGVPEFLEELAHRNVRRAIVTRNSRPMAKAMLAKLPGVFDPVITRDDGPVKPDPWGVNAICRAWRLPPSRVLMIGDYWFDIACGRSAGARTVLYSGGVEASQLADHAGADFVLPCFTRGTTLWDWLAKSL